MNALEDLQEWYLSQCNDDWEHAYGISIRNIDNPGWSLSVDLTDTYLELVQFKETSYGIGSEANLSGHNWAICKVEDQKFIGYGGPNKLEELITAFLLWAKENA